MAGHRRPAQRRRRPDGAFWRDRKRSGWLPRGRRWRWRRRRRWGRFGRTPLPVAGEPPTGVLTGCRPSAPPAALLHCSVAHLPKHQPVEDRHERPHFSARYTGLYCVCSGGAQVAHRLGHRTARGSARAGSHPVTASDATGVATNGQATQTHPTTGRRRPVGVALQRRPGPRCAAPQKATLANATGYCCTKRRRIGSPPAVASCGSP